jgi:hypothetical protein
MLSACSPSIHAEFHAEDADCGGYRLWYLVHADTAAAPLREVVHVVHNRDPFGK